MTIHFNNPIPVVVALLRVGDGLLAIQRAIQPKLGEWAFPGGYVNEGEDAQVAISREVHEETGFLLAPMLWWPIKTFITEKNQLLIFLRCNDMFEASHMESFTPTREASAVKIVSAVDELCFPIHTKMLRVPTLWS